MITTKVPVHNYSVTFMLDYITIQTNAIGISEDAAIFTATVLAAENLGINPTRFDTLYKDAWAEVSEENIDSIDIDIYDE